jgi:prophage maintenance system killer protein
VIAIEVADLVLIASRTLGLDAGQVLDLLDPRAAENALALARPDTGSPDPADSAAALLHALVAHEPMRLGNDQVALAAMLQFLAMNGWDMNPDPPAEVASVVTAVADGSRDVESVAEWLAARLRPRGLAPTPITEASMRRRMPLTEMFKMATMRIQPLGLFGRFTSDARRAVYLAQEEARLLRHNYIGTEHLLLGLLYLGEGIAAEAMSSLNITREEARSRIEEIIGLGTVAPAGHIPFTPRAKKVLELSLREAMRLGQHQIGTEHILLGIAREGEGIAAQVLTDLGAEPSRVRQRVTELVDEQERACRQEAQEGPAVPAALADAAEQLAQTRRLKEAAFESGDLERAAALRDLEKQQLAGKLRLERELITDVDVHAVIAENERLRGELHRARDLLRQHGIEPDGGTARTA